MMSLLNDPEQSVTVAIEILGLLAKFADFQLFAMNKSNKSN